MRERKSDFAVITKRKKKKKLCNRNRRASDALFDVNLFQEFMDQ